MSFTQRVKQGFLRLPATKKAIFIGSGALMVSAVLPWYDNRNSFGVGETYLGIQGPLFLIGTLVLLFGAVSFFNILFPLMGKNFFKLKRKMGATAALLGMQSLFLLAIANSVFYHPSFGTNVSHKGVRFGMFTAFASIAVMVISGWITHRREKAGKYEDIDEIMMNPEPEMRESENAYSVPQYTPPDAYSPAPGRAEAEPLTPDYGAGVDPLTLDAKTRYKMLRSQSRYSQAAKTNVWGGGQGSAFSRPADAYSGGQSRQAEDDGRIELSMDL